LKNAKKCRGIVVSGFTSVPIAAVYFEQNKVIVASIVHTGPFPVRQFSKEKAVVKVSGL